ncbi:Rpn family recombination-promoting nuclease/putative transposase [Tolypothrix campylonemoides VB511288]|nr:Rpn family recombination-promoting nuclease/putative transposase [Tolypothrix campylonemoides VB511288]
MKTDSLFYRLFQEFPSIFFEVISYSPETETAYQFSSVEIKQTAFRIDGVFLPIQDENPVYFVEVQFQLDLQIYSRLFAEIFLYLRQNQPQNDWRGVLVYPNRNLDTADIKHYREFFDSGRISRIYLDELGDAASLPIGIATIKLFIENQTTAITQAKQLIDRTRQEIDLEPQQQKLLQLIETILIYKFPTMSRKEIEAMFELSDLKQTRVYQEGVEEGERKGKLKTVPRFVALGLTIEQIAQELGLSVEEVRQAAQEEPAS